MNENNRYFYGYDNDYCFKKEDKCCHIKENNHYSKKEEQYCPKQENKHCPEKKQDQCCCKNDIRKSLELLSSDKIKGLLNFNAAAFISSFFTAGTFVTTLVGHSNLSPLLGTLNKISPCECDRIQISGFINYPVIGPTNASGDNANGISARTASLCNMKALAIEVNGADEATQTANYNLIREALRRFKCAKEDCNSKCDECCCGDGIISEVANGNLSGTSSLTVGPLVLQDVDVLACIGNTLILGSPFVPAAGGGGTAINAMIFVVCAEAVDYLF